jgi:CheY-like chemotaxis protein
LQSERAVKGSFDRTLQGLNILVVDDELDGRELIACILEQFGATVYQADAPRAALEVLSEHTPDIMISDIAMPGEDGYSLMRRVRSLGGDEPRNIPAIALTAFTRGVDQARALRAGFDLHIGKPLDPLTLVHAVRDLAGRRGRVRDDRERPPTSA